MVSDKTIVAAMFNLAPPTCDNFAMHGLLNIGWGDISLLGKPADAVRSSKTPILKPGETGFVVYKRKELFFTFIFFSAITTKPADARTRFLAMNSPVIVSIGNDGAKSIEGEMIATLNVPRR